MKVRGFIFITCMFISISINAQTNNLTHEIGILGGPVVFKSDYGLKSDSDINLDNVGIGIGLAYYLGFAGTGCDCLGTKNYFATHFKIRAELEYSHTKLENRGELTNANKSLSSMHGKTTVIEIGPSLEWYPFRSRTYYANTRPFAPYLSLGVHFVYFNPDAETDLPGRLGSTENTYPTFLGPNGESYITTVSDNTFSIVGSIGTRYRLNNMSDLVLEAQVDYYGSNAIDGIDIPKSTLNDWTASLRVGYIYRF